MFKTSFKADGVNVTRGVKSTFPDYEAKMLPYSVQAEGAYKCSLIYLVPGGVVESVSGDWNTNSAKAVSVGSSLTVLLTVVVAVAKQWVTL